MKNFKRINLVILLTTMLSACVVINDAALTFNLSKWQNADIKDYQFTVQETCGVSLPNCQTLVALPSYKVTVLNGSVSHVKSLLNTTLDSNTYPHLLDETWAMPIDAMFTELKQQLATQDNYLIQFDARYGFITKALNFEIQDFKVLKHTAYNKDLLEGGAAGWVDYWMSQVDGYIGADGYELTIYENCGEEICPKLIYPAYKVAVLHGEVVDVTHIYPSIHSGDASWALTVEDIYAALLLRLDELDDKQMQVREMGVIYKALNFTVTGFRIISEDYSAQDVQLHNAQQAWLAQGLTDYRLSYRVDCFCIYPSAEYGEALGADWDVTVRQGEVVSATVNGIEQALALTMDELYERVVAANAGALFTRINYAEDGQIFNARIERDYLGSDAHISYIGIQLTPL